jgi:hypothetical protein
MNATSLISSSLRLINATDAYNGPSVQELNDGLEIANDLLDSWNAEWLTKFGVNINEFPLTQNQQTYTLGTGGNFNIPRPSSIQAMSIVSLQNPAQPLELGIPILTDDQWQQLPVKIIYGSLPTQAYDDGAFPFRNISFWTIPTVAVNVRIYSSPLLTQFPDLITDIEFPPGYDKALRFNLAVDLAPEWGEEVPASVAAQAQMTKAVIKANNIVQVYSQCEAMLTNRGGYGYDYRSDLPAGGR